MEEEIPEVLQFHKYEARGEAEVRGSVDRADAMID
jgi:hypothetical protein